MSSYAASMAARSASRSSSKKAEGMLEPLLSDEDDASTASGSSTSSKSAEFEKHKPTLMQRLKQAVGKLYDEIEMEGEIICSSVCVLLR